MGNNTLSGLELRKAVAEKLGYKVEPGSFVGIVKDKWQLASPEGFVCDFGEGGGYYDSEELAWESAPPFESHLGALQYEGVISKLLSGEEFSIELHLLLNSSYSLAKLFRYTSEAPPTSLTGWALVGLDHLPTPAEALAAAICRAYLQLEEDQ